MLKIYRANIVLCPSYEESSTLFEAFFTSEPEASKTLADAVCRAESEFNVVFNDDGAAESDEGWFYASVGTVEVFDSNSEHSLDQEEKSRAAHVVFGNLLKSGF
jgi:hypothetical protein